MSVNIPTTIERFNGDTWERVHIIDDMIPSKPPLRSMRRVFFLSCPSWRSDPCEDAEQAIGSLGIYLSFNRETWRQVKDETV